jgi:hypothetical protein
MKLYVYARSPIDNWDCWLTPAQYLASIKGADDVFAASLLVEFGQRLYAGREAAKKHLRYQGDAGDGPYLCAIPLDEEDGYFDRVAAIKVEI